MILHRRPPVVWCGLDELLATIHRPGLINPNWPLCQEAMAVQHGWSAEEICDGELVVATDGRLYEDDEPYVTGFEGETRIPNCPACAAWAHA